MTEVDARLNRGELQALLAAIECLTTSKGLPDGWTGLWWMKRYHDRATLDGLRARFDEELKLLGE